MPEHPALSRLVLYRPLTAPRCGGHRPAGRETPRTGATILAVDDPNPRPPATPRSREAIIERVTREQEALHPSPVYSARSRRRLRNYLIGIGPAGMVLGWLSGWAFGWDTLERLGFGVGLVLTLGYVGFVLLAERDDGRIQDDVRRLVVPPHRPGDEGPRQPPG